MKRFYFVFAFFVSLLFAQSPYLDHSEASKLPRITLQASVCTDDWALCIEKSLETYDPHEASFPDEFAPFRSIFLRQIKEYYDENIGAELAADRKKIPDLSGKYFSKLETSLFALTPTTITFQFERTSYGGGVHGSYEITFRNFRRSDASPLTLKKLFLPGSDKKLLKIAERYYRLTYNIPDNESMEYDGWFDKSFELAENFAITPNGLLFVYNEYEIKPYSAGVTRFFLPYTAIKELIDPKGPLRFAKRRSFAKQHYTFREAPLTLMVDITHTKDIVDINVTMRTDKVTRSGNWLSVSFPQLQSKEALLLTDYNNFDRLKTYDTTDRLYNQRLQKSVPARYLLVEAYARTIYPNMDYSMHIRLKPPAVASPLIIDLRALAKTKERTFLAPYDYEGTLGQQGYTNYRILFDF